MIDNRDLRTILRKADPAADAEMPSVQRARMRANLSEAARAHHRFWTMRTALRLGAACTVALVAILIARRSIRPVGIEPPPVPVVSNQPEPLIAPPSSAAPPTFARPAVHRRGGPELTRNAGVPTTRIAFTAPEGTRILWFAPPAPVKEDS